MIRVDIEATLKYCFLDPRSYVRPDGRVHLFGEDMSVRRHEVWERTGGFCEEKGCHRNIYEETMELHHKIKRSKGGDDSMENLAGICRRCHTKHHGQVQSGKVQP